MLKNDVIGDEICGKLHPAEKSMLMTASGRVLTLVNTLEKPFESLRLFGKSEQRKTTGAQLLDPKLFDEDKTISGFSVHSNGDGSVDIKKTETGTGTVLYKLGDITDKLESGNYYTASNFNIGGALRIQFEQIRESGPIYSNKFKFDSSLDKQINVRIFLLTNETFSGTIYPMVNVGQTALPYEPYTGGIPAPNIEYPQDIVNAGKNGSVTVSVNGKNLLPFVVGEKGKNFEVFEDGVFIDGPRNTDFYAVGSQSNMIESSYEEVPELTPGDYQMLSSSEDVTLFCVAWRNNNTIVIGQSVTFPAKISVQKGDKFRIFFRIRGEKFTGKVKAMITREPVTLENYEPYRSQKLILSTPNGLPGIPVSKDGNYTDEKGQQWVCDEIDLGREKYVQRLAEQVYNKLNLILVDADNNKFQNVLQGTYKFKGATYPSMSNFAHYVAWANNKGSFAAFDKYFYYRHTEKITVDELNTLFNSMMPVKILGQLETPIERDLTAEEIEQYKALHTYKGTTVLGNDAGLWMEAKYKAKPAGMRNRMVK